MEVLSYGIHLILQPRHEDGECCEECGRVSACNADQFSLSRTRSGLRGT